MLFSYTRDEANHGMLLVNRAVSRSLMRSLPRLRPPPKSNRGCKEFRAFPPLEGKKIVLSLRPPLRPPRSQGIYSLPGSATPSFFSLQTFVYRSRYRSFED